MENRKETQYDSTDYKLYSKLHALFSTLLLREVPNEEIEKQVHYILQALTREEIDEFLSHLSNEPIPTAKDRAETILFYSIFATDNVDDITVYPVEDKRFVLSKEDAKNLTPKEKDVLEMLARTTSLHNPIYVTKENGVLLVG